MKRISARGTPSEPAEEPVARIDEATVKAILTGSCTLLREARIERGWHLRQLADEWGVSESVLSRLELARREPSLRQMIEAYAHLGRRFSDAHRIAEDQAFPLGGAPWDSGQSVDPLGEFR
jgi:ribosome-binding protein aMBF1 (putative translation factor)